MIKEEKMTTDKWPRNKQNKPSKKNGRLPLEIPESSFHVDFNHILETEGEVCTL